MWLTHVSDSRSCSNPSGVVDLALSVCVCVGTLYLCCSFTVLLCSRSTMKKTCSSTWRIATRACTVPERGRNKRERERETQQRQNEKKFIGQNNVQTVCDASRNYYYLVYPFGRVATAEWGRKASHKAEGGLPGLLLPGFLDERRLFEHMQVLLISCW